jgi:hypothetical protein
VILFCEGHSYGGLLLLLSLFYQFSNAFFALIQKEPIRSAVVYAEPVATGLVQNDIFP